MHGLAVSGDGATIYFTGAKYNLYAAAIDDEGRVGHRRRSD